jgi:two-component system KDP operon response regulator KdpE
MVVDFTRHQVRRQGKEIYLTNIEYKLLSYLAGNAGRVLTPNQLLEKIWGKEYIGATHILQVNIARLRHKLSDQVKDPKYILTRPGIGYMVSK